MSGEAESDGIRIALSPVQLAAVLENETLMAGATIGNRLIGALRLLGCGVEVVGATALAAAPEPTTLSKAGSLALAAHAADQCATGGVQLWSGRDQRSLSERAASSVARNLGASPGTAATIGMGVDIAVPIAAAAGAARALAVRAGRISLARHEAAAGSRLGGHTIARHVGQSEAQLRARLAATATRRRPPQAISSFHTLASAERSVSATCRAHRAAIESWAQTARQGSILRWTYSSGREVGHGVIRSTGQLERMTKVRVVLKMERFNDMPYFILTAFPIP